MQPTSRQLPPLSSIDPAPASLPARQAPAATTPVDRGAVRARWRGKLHAAYDALSGPLASPPATRGPAVPHAPRPAAPRTGPGRWVDGNSRLSDIFTAIRQSGAGDPSPTWIASRPVAQPNPDNFHGQMRIMRQASGVVEQAEAAHAPAAASPKRALARMAALWRGMRRKPSAQADQSPPPSAAEPAAPAP